jgi:peptide deformylase
MEIVHYPHPALRRKAEPLTTVTDQVRRDAAEMLRLMYAGNGIGLAANQVDLPYRIVVLNLTGDPEQKDQEQVLINPVILERQGTVEESEGCLSLPGLFVKVRRDEQVRVQASDLDGGPIDRTVSGLEARAWQHEIDHLDGVLIIDRAV